MMVFSGTMPGSLDLRQRPGNKAVRFDWAFFCSISKTHITARRYIARYPNHRRRAQATQKKPGRARETDI